MCWLLVQTRRIMQAANLQDGCLHTVHTANTAHSELLWLRACMTHERPIQQETALPCPHSICTKLEARAQSLPVCAFLRQRMQLVSRTHARSTTGLRRMHAGRLHVGGAVWAAHAGNACAPLGCHQRSGRPTAARPTAASHFACVRPARPAAVLRSASS